MLTDHFAEWYHSCTAWLACSAKKLDTVIQQLPCLPALQGCRKHLGQIGSCEVQQQADA